MYDYELFQLIDIGYAQWHLVKKEIEKKTNDIYNQLDPWPSG